MKLEDFRLLYCVYEKKREAEGESCQPFPDWLWANGYNVESVLQDEDEASQKCWLGNELNKIFDEHFKVFRIDGSKANRGE